MLNQWIKWIGGITGALLALVLRLGSLQAYPQVQGALQAITQAPHTLERLRLNLEVQTPPRFEVLVNIPATRLTVFDRGVPVLHYKVSVGTSRWPTPTGRFHINEIQWNPWWLPPESEWAEDAEKTPPGPNNPLYPVKLMMEKALRIHGTRSAWSIGRAASHGCMRMRRNEVRALAEYLESQLVPDHDPKVFEEYRKKTWRPYRTVLPKDQNIWVYLVYQPLERWSNQLVLHPNYYGRMIPYEEKILDLLMEAGVYFGPVDLGKFHDIRKKSRKSTVIPFQDLLADGASQENLPESFAPLCLAESPHLLKKIRERFNTRITTTPVPLFDVGQRFVLPAWGR